MRENYATTTVVASRPEPSEIAPKTTRSTARDYVFSRCRRPRWKYVPNGRFSFFFSFRLTDDRTKKKKIKSIGTATTPSVRVYRSGFTGVTTTGVYARERQTAKTISVRLVRIPFVLYRYECVRDRWEWIFFFFTSIIFVFLSELFSFYTRVRGRGKQKVPRTRRHRVYAEIRYIYIHISCVPSRFFYTVYVVYEASSSEGKKTRNLYALLSRARSFVLTKT